MPFEKEGGRFLRHRLDQVELTSLDQLGDSRDDAVIVDGITNRI